jgi:hypothetical protein
MTAAEADMPRHVWETAGIAFVKWRRLPKAVLYVF